MTTTENPADARRSRASLRFGYVVAIAINVALLVIVNNALDWELVEFLTDDFAQLTGLISFSLVATIVANAGFMVADRPRIKAPTQAALNIIGVVVSVRILQVFPFDFSTYDFDWGIVARGVLILAIAGSAVGAIVEFARFAGTLASPPGAAA